VCVNLLPKSQGKGKSSTRDFIREVKSVHCAVVKNRSMQAPFIGAYKNIWSGLRKYQSKCKKKFFFISLNVVWLFCITFNVFIFTKFCFYIHSTYFRGFKYNSTYYITYIHFERNLECNSFTLHYVRRFILHRSFFFFAKVPVGSKSRRKPRATSIYNV